MMNDRSRPSGGRSILDVVAEALFAHSGAFEALISGLSRHLTVLAYHRVSDPFVPGFDTSRAIVGAVPAEFAKQMDFIAQHFNVVSVVDVVAWLKGERGLPPRPALVTFDDGYRDNYENAFPILRERSLPAAIFLATDYIESASPFATDLIAYCFHHTLHEEADLPFMGRRSWQDERDKEAVKSEWKRVLKRLPDGQMRMALDRLPKELEVLVTEDAFAGLHLSWDHVREMVEAGVTMGGHTQSHSILTKVSLERAREEVAGSKARIEHETGQPVTAFAYPNGLSTDFNSDIEAVLTQAGYGVAFSLISGPARLSEVSRTPMSVRRTFISYKDSLPRFAAKVSGLARLAGRAR